MDYRSLIVGGLIEKARTRGKAVLKADEIFSSIWGGISDTNKRVIGKQFYDEVVAGNITGVTVNRKNAAGRAYYNI